MNWSFEKKVKQRRRASEKQNMLCTECLIYEKGAQRRKEGEYSSYKMLGGFLYPICLVFSLPAHVHILELFPNLKVF